MVIHRCARVKQAAPRLGVTRGWRASPIASVDVVLSCGERQIPSANVSLSHDTTMGAMRMCSAILCASIDIRFASVRRAPLCHSIRDVTSFAADPAILNRPWLPLLGHMDAVDLVFSGVSARHRTGLLAPARFWLRRRHPRWCPAAPAEVYCSLAALNLAGPL
jgi:hypothetical protein